MTEHEILHKWFGGQVNEFIDELIRHGFSQSESRNFLYELAQTAERRRGDHVLERSKR